MELQEIKKKLIEIFVEHGFKSKDIQENEDEQSTLRFSHKKVNYFICIEGEEDIHYGIESIDDTDYRPDFLAYRDELGDIDHFDGYLHGVKNGDFDDLRKAWLDLEKIENKYTESIFDFEEIIREKYAVF